LECTANVCHRGTVTRCSRGYEGTKMYIFLTILARLPPNDSENRKTYEKSELDVTSPSFVSTYNFYSKKKKFRSYTNTPRVMHEMREGMYACLHVRSVRY
jgi:hypothetical protein